MISCQPFTPDAWSVAMLIFFVPFGLFVTWYAVRGIRRRRLDMYRDPSLNPVGASAVLIAMGLLFVTWIVVGYIAWLHVCGSMLSGGVLHSVTQAISER